MPTLERNIYTQQSIDTVWRFIDDYTSTERWNVIVSTTERLEGSGEIGTIYRSVSEPFGNHQAIVYTVAIRVPSRRLVLDGMAGRVRFVETYDLQDLGQEVRLRHHLRYTTRGPAAVLLPVLGRKLRRTADESAKRLRTVLDEL